MSDMTDTSGAADLGSVDTDTIIGTNVHQILWRDRTSQAALAHALGLTPSVLSKKMRGDSAWSARQVSVTASFLGVEPGKLFSQVTLPKVRPNLVGLPGGGRTTAPTPPLLLISNTPVAP